MNIRLGTLPPASRLAGVLLLLAGAVSLARATAPTISQLTVKSALLGESIAIHVEVSDPDGNLNRVEFYVTKVGDSSEVLFSSVPAPGGSAVVDNTHAPTLEGYYTIRAKAVDASNENTSLSRTTEIFNARTTVGPTTFPASPSVTQITANGEILTQPNTTSTTIDTLSGSSVIFWAKSRIRLEPGFRARSGSVFWAAVDANMDGFSDVEAVTDTDHDGMSDAWEYAHGLDPFTNDAALDPDGDGLTNLQEYQQRSDPHIAYTPSNNNLGLKLFSPAF